MSNEKHDKKEGEPQPPVPSEQQAELSEDEQQTRHETAAREKFIQEIVIPSFFLTAEQQVRVAKYINETHGPWREYNGEDFRVIRSEVDGNVCRFTFGVYFDNYEAQRIDAEVPLT